MKRLFVILGVVCLLSTYVKADENTSAFVQGFANGFSQQYQPPRYYEPPRQYVPRMYVEPVYTEPVYRPSAPFCVVTNGASYCNYYSVSSCQSAAQSLGGICQGSR